MTYSQSESGLNFAINSAADFDSTSESGCESESDFGSVFMNLNNYIFLPYIYTLLNKLADGFFINSHNRINSNASNTSIIYIFFWYIIT